jgi:hypothetical protein
MDYATYYQEKLYPLQDKALERIRQVAPAFYLTGGTALSRFYLQHRYSEDLDLFVNRNKDFQSLTNKIIREFQKEFQKTRIQLSDTDFVRLFVREADTELKIEFINDVGYHFHDIIEEKGVVLDSWQNILANKISALSRNATKDYADILFLSLKYAFNWVDMYDAAKKKDTWVNEISSAQLIDEFEVNRLSEVHWINEEDDIREFKNHLHTIAKDILMAADNSLYRD